MKTLKEQIKDHDIGRLYLFFGEERYLVKLNLERMRRALMEPDDEMMNLDMQTSPTDLDQIRTSIETLPFMAEKRLVILQDTKVFSSKPPAALEGMDRVVADIPEETTVIFVETDVDKRSRMYKAVQKYGQAEEFDRLEEGALSSWIRQEFKHRGIRIGSGEIAWFLSLTGVDMAHIEGEIHKLASYVGERKEVTREDMNAIITPSIETTIFKLVDALADGHPADAYRIYKDLLQQGEAVYRILYMIMRQFRLLYRTSVSEQRDPYSLSKELGVPSFAAQNYQRQAARFGQERLKQILYKLLETDEAYKTGALSEQEAADLIILKYV